MITAYVPTADMVEHPAHYDIDGYETIDFIKEVLTPEQYKGFLMGNYIKYMDRADRKGNPEQDRAKAMQYRKRLMDER